MKHAPKNEDGSSNFLPLSYSMVAFQKLIFRERIYNVLNSWSEAETEVITGIDPDLAVARGAAWYGFVRRGNSIRIKSGSAHSYYIGIESSMPAVPGFPPPMDALCVVPFGTEDGSSFEVPMENLGLIIGESCQFRFFSSTERQEDQLGILLDEFSLDGLNEMAPMTAMLTDESGESGNIASVRLESELTEIGTLKLWFNEIDSERRWRLEFNLGEESEGSEVEETE